MAFKFGIIKNKIESLYGNTITECERKSLATLIYYPEEKLELIKKETENMDDWYRIILHRLIEVTRSVMLVNKKNLTIDAGTYTTSNNTMVIANKAGATLTINNGTFKGPYSSIENRSTLVINNGTFTGSSGIKNFIYEDSYNYTDCNCYFIVA